MAQEFYVSHVASMLKSKSVSPGYTYRQEDRKYHGLVYIISGELTVTLDDETIRATAGSVLLLRKHDRYQLENSGSTITKYIGVSYKTDPEDILQQFVPGRLFTTTYPQRYLDLFSIAAQLNTVRTICSQTRLRANVQEILCCIIQEDYHRSLAVTENYADKAMAYMECNYAEALTCEQIALSVGISVSHLRMLFRKHYNTSLVQALNRIRVQRAKEMLSSGMFTLSEVATACGFQNAYYFSRVFKQLAGVSPGKY